MTLAHHVVSPAAAWRAWSFDPAVVILLVVVTSLYWVGARRMRRASSGRRPSAARSCGFVLGMLVLAGALLSPLHGLSETLVAAHMAQHLLLMLVAAPLIALGDPVVPVVVGLPQPIRTPVSRLRRARTARALRRAVTNPVALWALGTLAVWAWHLPVLYTAALEHSLLHALEHASFLVTAVLFWRAVLPGARSARPAPAGVAILLVFATGLQSSVLGAVLTFATRALYPVHVGGARAWGLDPLTDQQLAGLVMWVPAGMIYVATMALLFLRWLKAEDGRAPAGLVVGQGEP